MKQLFIILLTIYCFSGIDAQSSNRWADYVDPMIGTHNSRWILFPGPTRPFGMVKLSPDNQELGWKAGYEYDIHNIAGFSHLHSWTMAGLLTMPTVGEVKIQPGTEIDPDRGYRSRFRHETEEASPGYYSVYLDDYDVQAELTSTKRTGVQRYTFPKSDSSRILLDLLIPSEYGFEIFYTQIKKVSDREIAGVSYQQSLRKANYNEYILHFVMRFDKDFESMNGWVKEEIMENVESISSGFGHKDVGAYFSFKTEEGEQIQVQTGISLVSIEQARLNLETELDPFNWDFDAIRQDAWHEWNELLGKIEVEGGKEEDKIKFYTNLYRAYAGRTTWSDVNGKYVDMYEKVQQLSDPSSPVYGSDGFWITFWNLNQLWTLVTPDIANKWVRSFLEIYDKGGWLPRGPTGIEYSAIMVASHQIALIVSAYQKGIRDYDIEKAWEAIYKLQTVQGKAHDAGGYVGNRHLDSYLSHGYVPDEVGPVSNTLAYAYDDWTVAQLAKSLGKKTEYKQFMHRAFNYRNVYDKEVGYMRRKHSDGSWVANFQKYGDVSWLGSGWVEGNAWQYSFFVPHDLQGLISLMGRDSFNEKLEQGFAESAPHHFNSEHLGSNSLDGMGVLPVNHGNQPNMQAAYLFNHSGKAWLTQKWVTEIMNEYYGATPKDGWLGDEDQGQMGAWYVMSAMGLFQMDGGTAYRPVYEIGRPLFDKVTIHLDPNYYPGRKFEILVENQASNHNYIQEASLNGRKLEGPWFYHDELTGGAVLQLKMGPNPNKTWGSDPKQAPPSMSTTLSEEEIAEILAFDKYAEDLKAWNEAVKAYYYHKKELFELLPDDRKEIIFLGNSITDNAEWSELFQNDRIKNRGIGGDDTAGILDRLDEVTASSPDKIFLMIGTNDLAYGKEISYVLSNYHKILSKIKQDSPDTELFIQSILPVDDQLHYTRPNKDIRSINVQLEKMAPDFDATYIDLWSQFKDRRGMLAKKYSLDGLHLNGRGYILWKSAIEKYIN